MNPPSVKPVCEEFMPEFIQIRDGMLAKMRSMDSEGGVIVAGSHEKACIQ
jgi:hypothetical protein